MKEIQVGQLKPDKKLHEQAENVSRNLGYDITPSPFSIDVFNASENDLKERFPNRFGVYTRTMRALNKGVQVPDGGSSQLIERLTAVEPIVERLNDYLERHYSGEQTLRKKQIGVFEDIRDFIEDGETQGYIKLPTGAGKTVLFTEIVEAVDLNTIIVVPTNILIHQTEKRVREFASQLDVGKVNEKLKQIGRQVTIITYASLVRGVENGLIDPTTYELLILDEAHKATSKRRVDTIAKFENALKLSFTATPRVDTEGNPVEPLGKEVHSMSLKEAVAEGMLSPFSAYIATTQIDLTNIKISSTGDYDSKDLDKAINTEARNRAAVDLYEELFAGEKGLAYCSTIHHAEKVAEVFNSRGIKAAVISGQMPREVQKQLLIDYHEGKYDVLCNADILIEGFDEQQVSVCLNLRPTLSTVVAEQRGGRVLRLDSNNPGKHAFIVDILDKDSKTVTFAEVAEGALVTPYKPKSLEDSEEIYPPGDRPSIEIVGLEVITEAEEVMKLVALRSQSEDKIPKGFSVMPSQRLRSEYSVPVTSFWKLVQKLKNENPDEFIPSSPGRPDLITNKILEELEIILQDRARNLNGDRIIEAQSFEQVQIGPLSREYGLSYKSIRKALNKLIEEGQGTTTVGAKNTAVKYFLSNEAIGQLHERLGNTAREQEVRMGKGASEEIPPGFTEIPTSYIKKTLGISHAKYDSIIHRAKMKYPGQFISRGPGVPMLVSGEVLGEIMKKFDSNS